jgi:pilus assembly protein CpaF
MEIFTQSEFSDLISKIQASLERSSSSTDDDVKECSRKFIQQAIPPKMYVSPAELSELINRAFNNIKKLGILQELIEDKSITEIMINGYDTIFIEKDGSLFKSDKQFDSKLQLENAIQKIVAKVNRTVDALNPICDARLEDGSRVNIVLNPIALNGPIVTIRKFPDKVINFRDLKNWGAVNDDITEFLMSCVKAKYNIFVSGGTGSGKTTFLNALSNFIPEDERIITIEDSAELQIKTVKNFVRLETRNANTEGKGEITIRDLIKSSLRMRPERIVVGEVRGAEALDMLQAMNTGHDGSLSTGHANSPRDMLTRLETMVLTGADFPIEAIRQQIASAIDILVHLSRLPDKSRKVVEICEVTGFENGEYKLNPLYVFEKTDEAFDKEGKRKIIGKHKKVNSIHNKDKFRMYGINI